MTFRLHHFALSVVDAERSSAFYGGLGFSAVSSFTKPEIGATIIRLALGSSILELLQLEGAQAHPRRGVVSVDELRSVGPHHLALCVDNLNAAIAVLRSRGVDVPEARRSAAGERHVFFRDPDGIPIELLER